MCVVDGWAREREEKALECISLAGGCPAVALCVCAWPHKVCGLHEKFVPLKSRGLLRAPVPEEAQQMRGHFTSHIRRPLATVPDILQPHFGAGLAGEVHADLPIRRVDVRIRMAVCMISLERTLMKSIGLNVVDCTNSGACLMWLLCFVRPLATFYFCFAAAVRPHSNPLLTPDRIPAVPRDRHRCACPGPDSSSISSALVRGWPT